MMRRFQFGFGPGGAPPMGPRMFGRGDLKFALLDLLRERPQHGYEMIKALEERSGGFYTPSAGAIYPTLQLLEDRGWVTIEQTEGKKVYALTDAGRAALQEREQRAEQFGGPRGGWGPRGEGHEGHEHHGHHEHEGHERHEGRGGWRGRGPFGREAPPELGALGREGFEVARLMRAAVMSTGGDQARLAQLRSIVERTRAELQAFLSQSGQPQPEQPNPTAPDAPQASAGNGPVEMA